MGPASYNFSETMSTLFFADSAKKIKNKPKINGAPRAPSPARARRSEALDAHDALVCPCTEDPKDTQLRQYQEQIAQLKAQLEAKAGGGSLAGGKKSKKKKKKKKTKAIRYDPEGACLR